MNTSVGLRRPQARGLISLVVAALLVVGVAPAVEALGRLVPVIVESRDSVTAGDEVRAVQGEVDRDLAIVNSVSARVPESRLAELSARTFVFPDRAIKMQSASYGDGLVSAYPAEVGATKLWRGGNAGEGVTVALIDTGVADVADLHGSVVAAANFTRERSFLDTFGHGTFQAGLIAGNGASSDGRYVGVAPKADLMSVKVADATGATSLGQVLAGVQLVDSAADRFNVRVALLAINSGSPFPPEFDPLSRALRTLWAHGVLVVVPAGNDGPEAGTIAAPGEDPVLLTAGSVFDHGTATVSDDTMSDFSSRGPTRWGDDKPDLVAPGEHLVSVRAPGSTVDESNPSARVDGDYFKGSGTSMSAAVTAGAAALLLAARPELNPDQAKALLMATAEPLTDATGAEEGAGVLDAANAAAFDSLPDLPDAPDMGERMSPFTPKGLDFGWQRDDTAGAYLWVARQWNARAWAARQWSDDEWEARQWNARAWAARAWDARAWAARQWDARAWEARQWMARSWAARSWAARAWIARQWDARSWDARAWVARSWDARQWDARSWDARSWDGRSWDARSWDARAWDARAWESRSWVSRSWDSRSWDSRSWDSRSWDSRSWDSRSWDSRSWDSRSWDSRSWDSRSWNSTGWG